MIVDSHVHIFRRLDGFTGAGRVRPLPYGMVQIGEGRPFRLLPPALERTNFPAEILLEYMAAAGVDRAVLMQGPLYGDMNDYYAEVLLRWPDRFLGVALVDPADTQGPALLDRLVHEQGFKAVKLEMTDSLGLCSRDPDFKLSNPAFTWLWETINRAEIIDHPRPGADDRPLLPDQRAARPNSALPGCALDHCPPGPAEKPDVGRTRS